MKRVLLVGDGRNLAVPERATDGANHAYSKALFEAGAITYIAPCYQTMTDEQLNQYVNGFDGIFFAGGYDVNPERYKEDLYADAQVKIDKWRDVFEPQILLLALKQKIPVGGACRGCQNAAVTTGGSLYQDIALQLKMASTHTLASEAARFSPQHRIKIDDDSRLREVIGDSKWYVNSRHHQSVRESGDFRVVAQADDGVVEAIELPDGINPFGIFVQCHPEDMVGYCPKARAFFQAFVDSL